MPDTPNGDPRRPCGGIYNHPGCLKLQIFDISNFPHFQLLTCHHRSGHGCIDETGSAFLGRCNQNFFNNCTLGSSSA